MLTHRVNTIITEEDDKYDEVQHIKNVLSIAAYSKWVWQALGRRKLNPQPNHRDHIWANGHVTVPFVQGITEPIRRLIRKEGVTAHIKPHTTSRKLLVALKDRDKPEDKCGVVYDLTFQDCDAQYVGETERPLKHCIKEHSKDSSSMDHHMGFHQHKLDTDNMKILDPQRSVREALQIHSRSPLS